MERAVTIAHRALAESAKAPGASAMSVVLAGSRGELIGALTFERHRAEPFTDETLQLAEAIAALLGPQVGLQLRANRFVAGRIIDRFGDGYEALFGPRRPGLKLGAVGVIALALALIFAKGEHRVTAKSVLEAEVQRAAVAPFDGFIRAAPVRAGDTVRSGDLLAALDDRDLVLDRLKWRAERDKLLQRHREALAKHDRNNLVVLEPQIRQAEAQLALAEEKLARARILAPFDGIVVSGDLSQMLGSPVEKGKTLFEIAPLNSYRLIVQVDERDVRYIAVGQSGTVALAGRPGDAGADDPEQDHARHGRRGRTQFLPGRGSAVGTRPAPATGDGRRRQDRSRSTLDRVDLDAPRRRLAAPCRMEVPALSAST